MLDAGVDLRGVQLAARHADPRTTMRYGSPHQPRPPPELHPGRLHGFRHLTQPASPATRAAGTPDIADVRARTARDPRMRDDFAVVARLIYQTLVTRMSAGR